MPDEDTAEVLPRCPCGTTRVSKYAVANREYTLLGVCYLLWGGTAVPTKVAFSCVRCGRIIDTVTGSREAMRTFVV
jgi:hypothetical protein